MITPVTIRPATGTPASSAPRSRRALAVAGLVALLAACSGSDDTATPTGTTPAETAVATEPAGPVATEPAGPADADLAAAALLAPEDLEGDWSSGGRLRFPNSAELARTVPACASAAEVVFEGGAQHGAGVSGSLSRMGSPVFLYVAIFPAEEGATAMMDAVTDPGFAECWARFNDVAVPELLGVASASYTTAPPPTLAVTADEISVQFLEGTVEAAAGGATFEDTCVCAFVRVGRGVVEVHSTVPTLTEEERAAVIQAAADKLAGVLATGDA